MIWPVDVGVTVAKRSVERFDLTKQIDIVMLHPHAHSTFTLYACSFIYSPHVISAFPPFIRHERVVRQRTVLFRLTNESNRIRWHNGCD